jgi:hypothetical protein
MAQRVNKTQRYEELPDASTPIWRYLDLPKFLALLRTRALYLCRADLFGDPFEGSFTEGSLREHEQEFSSKFPDNLVTMTQWIPCRSFVSCWHVAEFESAALWKIYASSQGSVAIRSSVGTLKNLFPEKDDRRGDFLVCQAVRLVQYIDYRNEHPYLNDLMGPLCYKRRAFSYEQEIRVILQELPTVQARNRPNGRAIAVGPPPEEKGKEVQVDLETLLDAVYVAPSSPRWLRDAVEETMNRFELQRVPCRQSTLDELPEFGTFGT